MVKVSDVIAKEDEDKVITIGNQSDEKYLETILNKFTKYNYVYIKFLPFVNQLMRVKKYYHYLKFHGIREVEMRMNVFDEDRNDPNKMIEVKIAKWEQIPRLKKYREEEKEYLEGESVL